MTARQSGTAADNGSDDNLVDHGRGQFSLVGCVGLSNAGRLSVNGSQKFLGHESITINLARAECASTVGLALLLEWSSWCGSNGMQLTYELPEADLLAIIEANNVSDMLPISSEPACNHFSPDGNFMQRS